MGKSPPWLPPPSRSRSLLLPRGSTPSGSEDPSWPPSPHSSRCGSPSRSTTSAAHPLSTASASKSTKNTWTIATRRGLFFILLRFLFHFQIFLGFLLYFINFIFHETFRCCNLCLEILCKRLIFISPTNKEIT